uniref:GLOBIN domain-containing protein n=1 Tax=Parastrongyloides trichosuri TaxID=131310 RepID=A0A0N4ZDB9_PARTI
MNNAEVKALTRKSIECLKLDDEKAAVPNGLEFYKFLFKNAPQLKKFFKGAEDYTPEQVEKSDRFAKQGVRHMLSMHVLADTYDDQATFLAFTRELANKHLAFKIPDETFEAFFPLWVDFLSSKGLTAEGKAAWLQLGKTFTAEFRKHLRAH